MFKMIDNFIDTGTIKTSILQLIMRFFLFKMILRYIHKLTVKTLINMKGLTVGTTFV